MTFRLVSLLMIFGLAGCSLDPASQSVTDAYRVIHAREPEGELDPKYRYLRVEVEGRPAYMALGYVDQAKGGPVDVWYSSDRNVLRLQNGRLVGSTMESGVDWLSVSYAHLPDWNAIGDQAVFERRRDVNPGYRYGIIEKMLIRRIPAPKDSHLLRMPASSLSWFEETVVGADSLPSRYAVNEKGKVIYAEQCLSREFCLSWQDWPYSDMGAH